LNVIQNALLFLRSHDASPLRLIPSLDRIFIDGEVNAGLNFDYQRAITFAIFQRIASQSFNEKALVG